MKKLLSILAVVMVTTNVMADNHLKFKGVEIDGSFAKFSSELVKQGYSIILERSDGVVLTGKFAGLDDCVVALSATSKEKVVYSVGVFLPKRDNWRSLKLMYENFKTNLTEKYGIPAAEEHSFDYPFEEGDGYEMLALTNNKCKYAAVFVTDLGYISIKVITAENNKGRVIIIYDDKINKQLEEESEKDSMTNDL